MSAEVDRAFGLWLKSRRQAFGISFTRIAEMIGVWPEAIWQIEALAHKPSPELRKRLTEALAVLIDHKMEPLP